METLKSYLNSRTLEEKRKVESSKQIKVRKNNIKNVHVVDCDDYSQNNNKGRQSRENNQS